MKKKSPKTEHPDKTEKRANKDQIKKNKVNAASLKTTADLMEISEFSDGHFIRRNGRLMEIVQLLGNNVRNADPMEIMRLIEAHARYFRQQSKDFKIVTLNYPTNTKTQQDNLETVINSGRVTDPVCVQYLKEELAVLEFLETYRTETVYFMFLYAEDEKDLMLQKQALLNSGAFHVRELDRNGQIMLLKKLCNMNDDIKL